MGAVGVVYHCQSNLIVKFSFSTKFARNQLIKEAEVYMRLTEQRSKLKIPTFYGLFKCGDEMAIILSDDGMKLSSFESLSVEQR